MQKTDTVRLRHMLDAAREALTFAQGRSRSDLDKDRMLVLALVKSIEIIGEAASKVSLETCSAVPGLPWSSIVGMRNRLIHTYPPSNKAPQPNFRLFACHFRRPKCQPLLLLLIPYLH